MVASSSLGLLARSRRPVGAAFLALAGVLTSFPEDVAAQEVVRVHRVVVVEGEADAVWAVLGDFGNFDRWYPPAAVTVLDATGQTRTVTLDAGGEVVERLTATGKRRLSYELLSGRLPVTRYEASLAVWPSTVPDRSVVEWQAEAVPEEGVVPAELASRIGSVLDAGLDGLDDLFPVVPTQTLP